MRRMLTLAMVMEAWAEGAAKATAPSANMPVTSENLMELPPFSADRLG